MLISDGIANVLTMPTGSREYAIADHLGSTRVMLDSMGGTISANNYEPFGNPQVVTGATPRQSFIDKEQDRENALDNEIPAYTARRNDRQERSLPAGRRV
jgi:hypothetical protein